MNTPSDTSGSDRPLPFLWHRDDVEALDRASSFEEVGKIVLAVLMRSARKMTMISGPITSGGEDCPHKNVSKYQLAIEFQQRRGHHVFNQMPGEAAMARHRDEWLAKPTSEGQYCYLLLEGVYAPLYKSGMVERVAFMPNWQTSIGASWEYDLARKLGLHVEHFPDNWLTHFEAPHAATS